MDARPEVIACKAMTERGKGERPTPGRAEDGRTAQGGADDVVSTAPKEGGWEGGGTDVVSGPELSAGTVSGPERTTDGPVSGPEAQLARHREARDGRPAGA